MNAPSAREERTLLIFERGAPGRGSDLYPASGVPPAPLDPALRRAAPPALAEVSEVEAVRHYTWLSTRNHGVETGFYPLGSCTMKYNPKENEAFARLPGFAGVHPRQDPATAQGCLALMHGLADGLARVCGMDAFSLQPAAGAHGELAGLMVIRAYHRHRGDAKRTVVLVPDSAHGTNPASAAMAGFDVREVPSGADGMVDLDALDRLLGDDVAALMMTNPNTLGLFERNIEAIADRVHRAGALLYYDGANANAILMHARPGDMGFDVVHLNLHKTFSTPHGGGGPGAGPIGVRAHLAPFLPIPVVVRDDATGAYRLDADRPLSIGPVRSFYGNFGVLVRAYAYLRRNGEAGLMEVAEAAVGNASYLRERLRGAYRMAFDAPSMHEFVVTGTPQKEAGSSTLDVAKRIIDYGYHPPTVYFPLVVKEALMVEPTETETRETLDAFADAMLRIAEEVRTDPGLLHGAPHGTPVSRLDELRAARTPVLRWTPPAGGGPGAS